MNPPNWGESKAGEACRVDWVTDESSYVREALRSADIQIGILLWRRVHLLLKIAIHPR